MTGAVVRLKALSTVELKVTLPPTVAGLANVLARTVFPCKSTASLYVCAPRPTVLPLSVAVVLLFLVVTVGAAVVPAALKIVRPPR